MIYNECLNNQCQACVAEPASTGVHQQDITEKIQTQQTQEGEHGIGIFIQKLANS